MKKTILAVVVFIYSIINVQAQLSRDLIAFRELDVTDKIQVNLIPSNSDKIIIEGELANQMELTQVDDVLRLKMTGSYILQGNKVNVTLYSTKVSSIIARKGSVVHVRETELQQDSLYLSVNEGAELHARVHTNKLQALATTGARLNLEGEAREQNVNVAFGGNYLAKNLLSDDATVRINAGGRLEVNASETVDAQTRAGGTIDIYGNPKKKKDKRIAGGKINYL